MKTLLRSRKQDFARCLTEKMLIYALGRGLDYYDEPTVARIAFMLEKNDYRFSTLIAGIVKSPAFLTRRGTSQAEPVTACKLARAEAGRNLVADDVRRRALFACCEDEISPLPYVSGYEARGACYPASSVFACASAESPLPPSIRAISSTRACAFHRVRCETVRPR